MSSGIYSANKTPPFNFPGLPRAAEFGPSPFPLLKLAFGLLIPSNDRSKAEF